MACLPIDQLADRRSEYRKVGRPPGANLRANFTDPLIANEAIAHVPDRTLPRLFSIND